MRGLELAIRPGRCYNSTHNKIQIEKGVDIMSNIFKGINWKKTGIFAAGVAFGTAGIKILSSNDAKKVYTNCTAAALRAKDCVMKTVSTVQENAEDIYADAKSINEERARQQEQEFAADAQEASEDAE